LFVVIFGRSFEIVDEAFAFPLREMFEHVPNFVEEAKPEIIQSIVAQC
jgi:hypothetical protein